MIIFCCVRGWKFFKNNENVLSKTTFLRCLTVNLKRFQLTEETCLGVSVRMFQRTLAGAEWPTHQVGGSLQWVPSCEASAPVAAVAYSTPIRLLLSFGEHEPSTRLSRQLSQLLPPPNWGSWSILFHWVGNSGFAVFQCVDRKYCITQPLICKPVS